MRKAGLLSRNHSTICQVTGALMRNVNKAYPECNNNAGCGALFVKAEQLANYKEDRPFHASNVGTRSREDITLTTT